MRFSLSETNLVSQTDSEASGGQEPNLFRNWFSVAAVSLLAAIAVSVLVMRVTEAQLRKDAKANVELEQEGIRNAFERSRHLPVSLANHPHVVETLRDVSPDAYTWAQKANRYLEVVNDAAGTSLLYVIDMQGLTRAASNWRSEQSLVGNAYRYRPYFQHAVKGDETRYYAVGATTGEAGYYFAQPVKAGEKIIGVAVAKIELESMQQQWLTKTRPSLLVDEHGLVIMASEASWRFRSTRALSNDEIAEFREQRKYANHALDPLAISESIDAERIRIDGRHYLVSRALLPLQNWQVLQLIPVSSVYRAGIASAIVSQLFIGLSIVGYLYRRERKRKNSLRAAAMDAQTMRVLNRKLQSEISDRRKAEEELRETQAELIQASKLAALGQMSAAIAHEVNQPLSAIRTYSASATVLLDRQRHAEVRTNLDKIKSLTERLATLTTDLKTFARKSDQVREPVVLQDCIDVVHGMMKEDMRERQIQLKISVPDSPVVVMGTAIRIEQVLSNLIRNAMDATDEVHDAGIVKLTLTIDEDDAIIRIEDNGTGLDTSAMERLFEPFFTTKPLGEGVGLGLAISYGIIEELGGNLRVRNLDDGGAMFSVRLPFGKGKGAMS
ncbi:MAG: ATP-binding protein [Granulosicoccus sp.]